MKPWDTWSRLDPDTPVIVGVGTATQHVIDPGGGDDALHLDLIGQKITISGVEFTL